MANDLAATRLLGSLEGKRILELGCGTGDTAIGFARQGATVIAVDTSAANIASARAAATEAEVRLEFHAGDLADLAFLRADSVDGAFSEGALAALSDPSRVFRQIHRVLRTEAPFVFTLPHPFAFCLEEEANGAEGTVRSIVARSYFDDAPIHAAAPGGGPGEPTDTTYPHTINRVFTALVRCGYRIDMLGEPEPPRGNDARALVPPIIVWRARKEGA